MTKWHHQLNIIIIALKYLPEHWGTCCMTRDQLYHINLLLQKHFTTITRIEIWQAK